MDEKRYKCLKCGIIVTLADLKAGKGGLVNKKVLCEAHFNEIAQKVAEKTKVQEPREKRDDGALGPAEGHLNDTERSKEEKPVSRRVARTDRRRVGERTGSRPVRASQQNKRAATDKGSAGEGTPADEDVFESEDSGFIRSSGNKLLFVLAGLAGILIMAIIIALLMSDSDEPIVVQSDAGRETGVDQTRQPDESENGTGPAEPIQEDGDGTSQTEEDLRLRELAERFKGIAQKASEEFNGEVSGFVRGQNYLRRAVIDHSDFRDTGFVESARELIEDERIRINAAINEVFEPLSKEVFNLARADRYKEALKKAEEFPYSFRSFGDWGDTQSNLVKSVRDTGMARAEQWITAARTMADAGNFNQAVSLLEETLEVTQEHLFPEMLEKLTLAIENIQSVRDELKESGIAVEGSGFGHADVEIWFDFNDERPHNATYRYGTVSQQNNMPGSRGCYKSHYNPDGQHQSELCAIYYRFRHHPEQYISFWYYLQKPIEQMTFFSWHVEEKKPCYVYIKKPVIGEWTFYSVKMSELRTWTSPPIHPKDGDMFSSFQVTLGKTGDPEAGLYIDKLAVTNGEPGYLIPASRTARQEFFSGISMTLKEDFCAMNFGVLLRAKARLGTNVNKNSVMVAGGMHTRPSFLRNTARSIPDIDLQRTRSAGGKTLISQVADALERDLKSSNPAVTVIMVGTQDVINGNDLDNAREVFEGMINTCFTYGSIPVVVGIPYIFNDDLLVGVGKLNNAASAAAFANSVPFIDAFRMVTGEGPEGTKSFFSSEIRLNAKAYDAIDRTFEKLYLILREHVLSGP